METATKNGKESTSDYYNPDLNKIKTDDYFPEKLAKAKAYFKEHGLPDFNRIQKDAEEKLVTEKC